jgi:hypothetical protein
MLVLRERVEQRSRARGARLAHDAAEAAETEFFLIASRFDDTNCGYRVVVNNIDGNRAMYCHMQDGSASHLAVGQRIFAGFTRTGGVGNTGTQPMGYHLHIGVDSSSGASRPSYWNYTDTRPSASMYNDGGC